MLALMDLSHGEDKGTKGEQLICSASIMQFKNELCRKGRHFEERSFTFGSSLQ